MSTTVLFLPGADADYRWLRVDAGQVVARGEGLPALVPDEETVAVAPADAVTLHWAELPERSDAQATAAARLLAAESSATGAGELHVAVGRETDVVERPIGVVAVEQMRGWLATLAAGGVDPVRVLPAPLLLPRPSEGYVRADLGGQGVVRGALAGFADEARLTELVTGGVAPAVLPRDALDAAIAAAVAAPALDLRQGMFARRQRRGIDWRLVRRLALLAAALVAVTLLTDVVRLVRYSLAADAAEARADALARGGLPRGETVGDADRQLQSRLTALRGPGVGFTSTAGALFRTLRTVPGTELTALAFDENGDLRATLATQGEAQVADVKQRLEQAGFAVDAGTFTSANGRATGTLTVRPR